MPLNSTHPGYDENLPTWLRARDVLAGEDAIKAGGQHYLPRLDSQSDDEFAAYVNRASFFNATARTAEAYIGLVFRRPPFLKIPDDGAPAARALNEFADDADMLGTSLTGYAKNVVSDVLAVGRGGTLVDWGGSITGDRGDENRAYATFYTAEQIINWRVERVRGRNVPTLIVLREAALKVGEDEFEPEVVEQIRVLKLVDDRSLMVDGPESSEPFCRVEVWQEKESSTRGFLGLGGSTTKKEWVLVESRVPRRLGRPLSMIPFVFHGPRHARADVDRGPLENILAVNLDHYRLDADFKHGLHFTALPTAWVSGFDTKTNLKVGPSAVWQTETLGATAGFLEFKGEGLATFERAMDRAEKLMALLGSRMLEEDKRVGETATAIELRQAGEYSILGSVSASVSESLTHVLRWVYWWNSTEENPEDIGPEQVLLQLNSDFSVKGLASQDLQAVVAAWQAGALSTESMHEIFRRGEILPEGRTAEEEARLISQTRNERTIGPSDNSTIGQKANERQTDGIEV